MEVAIIVIVVFVVLLFLVILAIRLCNKYNCLGCCDSDAESLDDLEVAAEGDDHSDTLDEEENGEEILDECRGRNMEEEEGEQGGEGEDLNANHTEVTTDFQGNRYGDEEQVTLEIDGEEYVINRLEESLL